MPYSKFSFEDMILRDHLAYERTVLAIERTLLAYLRTGLALLAAGATLIRLFPGDIYFTVLGGAMLVIGLIVNGVGLGRFVSVSRKLKKIGVKSED
ncbi:MAG: hypothetical protein AXA67_12205 [Methylothermaceae bacteria B42]|nr:MAG: hypothetical protein AXA67_12205 [Methylothermaceae bacteria B42]HHJ39293.1 DUF202 domain-containing protein [Methylothermaceae bacterium]